MPRVSVGMPVYNNVATIERAIVSILCQTFRDFELIISDNASTDGTTAIIGRLAARDPRIAHIRQPETVSAAENFRIVLLEAKAPYFMWAAGDDYWCDTFIEKNLAALEADPELVGSTSKVQFTHNGEPVELAGIDGNLALMGTVRENIYHYLQDPGSMGLIYSLTRRESLVASYPSESFHALDWAITLGTLRFGKYNMIDEVLLVRDNTEISGYTKQVDIDNKTYLTRLFPLLPFTRYAIFKLRIPLSRWTIVSLIEMNARFHRSYALYKYPRYGKCIGVVFGAVDKVFRALFR
ncbi:MAG: glycosyltransferase family 2 protein [Alphaproteobacteria bacterium]